MTVAPFDPDGRSEVPCGLAATPRAAARSAWGRSPTPAVPRVPLRSRARGLVLSVLSAAGALSAGEPAALAKDTWTTPFPGAKHLFRTTAEPNRIHALVVDLCVPGVGVRATASAERKRTTSSFGKLVKAEAAVNGDFFSYGTYATSGLSMGDGAAWKDTSDSTSSGQVAFGPAKALFFAPSVKLAAPPEGVQEIVSGRPRIVDSGKAITSFDCGSHYCEKHPRTGVGFSKDRRTLFVFVVDGRTNISVGMTMKGLGALAASLGAYDAMNLDGGGSSTMWLSGEGVVNDPSDGSERVVANHLAVRADGVAKGLAAVCPEIPDEELLASTHELDGTATSDVDGDGKADVCARAAKGFLCHPDVGAGLGEPWLIPDLADAQGFDEPARFATIRMGDIDGDGKADVCARGADGVRCFRSNGAGFDPAIAGPALTDDSGWAGIDNASTLRLADVTGDGRDDLCARANAGIRCWPAQDGGFGDAFEGPALSDADGWDAPHRFGTIRMGDVDGDGRFDLCARAGAGMRCWLSDGAGFPTQIEGPGWIDGNGWGALRYWSTIRLADVNGDGKADVCARAAKGVVCHLSTGGGFGPVVAGPELSDASGWGDQANYLTLRMGDVSGDGSADLCARADAGLRCWLWTGNGFGPALEGPELSDAKGWYRHRYFRSVRLADVDGDGKADVCARAAAGVVCWRSDGASFAAQIEGPKWSDDNGWGEIGYYSTLRVAGPRPTPAGGEGGGGAGGGTGEGTGESNGGASGGGGQPGMGEGGAIAGAGGGAYGDMAPGAGEGGCACGVPRGGGAAASALGGAVAAIGASLARRRMRWREA